MHHLLPKQINNSTQNEHAILHECTNNANNRTIAINTASTTINFTENESALLQAIMRDLSSEIQVCPTPTRYSNALVNRSQLDGGAIAAELGHGNGDFVNLAGTTSRTRSQVADGSCWSFSERYQEDFRREEDSEVDSEEDGEGRRGCEWRGGRS